MSAVMKTAGSVIGSVASILPGPWQPFAIAASIALNIGSALLQKKPPVLGSPNEVRIGANNPSPYAMGRTYVGGTMGHDVGWGPTLKDVPNPYRSMVLIGNAAGPSEAIETFQADHATVTFSGANAVGHYKDRLYLSTQLGAAPEASALTSPFGYPNGWSAAHKLSGKTAWMITLVDDRDGKTYSGGIPKFGVIGRWAKVYDPRQDSTYPGGSGTCRVVDEDTYKGGAAAENPGCHGVTYALGRWQNGKKVMGVGLAAPGVDASNPVEAVNAIDWPAWTEFANVCDVNGWKIGGVVWEPGSRWDNLKRICEAGGARPAWVGGKLTVIFPRPRVALDTITADDLAGPVRIVGMRTWKGRKNILVPKVRLETHKWEHVQIEEVRAETYITEDGQEESEEYPLELVQQGTQGAQLAAYELVNRRELGPIILPCKVRLRGYRPGDALNVHLPSEGLDNRLCVITGRRVTPGAQGVAPTVEFTLETETTAKHDFALGRIGNAPPTPALVAGPEIDAATTRTLGEVSGLPEIVEKVGGIAEGATKNREFRQTTDPALNPANGVVDGDGWTDTSTSPQQRKIRIGGTWQTSANYIVDTNQLNDGAGLGDTAIWGGLTDVPTILEDGTIEAGRDKLLTIEAGATLGPNLVAQASRVGRAFTLAGFGNENVVYVRDGTAPGPNRANNHIRLDAGQNAAIFGDDIPVTVGERLFVAAEIGRSGTTGLGAYLFVYFLRGDGSVLSSAVIDGTTLTQDTLPDGSWQGVAASFVIPEGCARVRVGGARQNGAGSWYISSPYVGRQELAATDGALIGGNLRRPDNTIPAPVELENDYLRINAEAGTVYFSREISPGVFVNIDQVPLSDAGIAGLAYKDAVNLASGEVTGKSLANLDGAANTKLAGIEPGATLGPNLIAQANRVGRAYTDAGGGTVVYVRDGTAAAANYVNNHIRLDAGQGAAIFGDEIPVVAGERIYVFAEIGRSGTTGSGAFLYYYFLRGDGSNIAADLFYETVTTNGDLADGQWKPLKTSFVAPPGCARVRIGCGRYVGNGSWYFANPYVGRQELAATDGAFIGGNLRRPDNSIPAPVELENDYLRVNGDAGIIYVSREVSPGVFTNIDALPLADAGVAALAYKSAVNLASGDVTGKSLANLDGAANTKLGGIEAGATVGATWGANLANQPASLTAINSTEGTKLGGIETGADVTKNQQVIVQAPPAIRVAADSAGNMPSGTLPRTALMTVTKGGSSIRAANNVSYAAAFSGGTGSINNTNGSGDKGTISWSTITADEAYVSVTATVDGIAHPAVRHYFYRERAASTVGSPPSGGSGDGPLYDSEPCVAAVSATSNVELVPAFTVRAGGGGKIELLLSVSYAQASGPGDSTLTAGIYIRTEGSGSFVLVGSEGTGSQAVRLGAVESPDDSTGYLLVDVDATGLTAGDDYEVKVLGRVAGTSPSALLSGQLEGTAG